MSSPEIQPQTGSSAERYADIALPIAVREVFTYALPPAFAASVQPGMRVWVPLRGRMNIGMVVKVHGEKPAFKTRPVARVLDTEPVLDAGLLSLTEWMQRFYVCGWGEVIQAALPSGLNFSAQTFVRAVPPQEKAVIPLTRQEQRIYDEIREVKRLSWREARQRWSNEERALDSVKKKGLLQLWDEPSLDLQPRMENCWIWANPQREEIARRAVTGRLNKWEEAWLQLLETDPLPATTAALTAAMPEVLTAYTLSRLQKEGVLGREMREVRLPEPAFAYRPEQISALNEEQQQMTQTLIEPLEAGQYAKFLLFGVTGSGKTEVYIHLIKRALELGSGALVLVPEIALTPQTVRRFYLIFGPKIAILHSRLSDRERYEAWQALRRGEKNIVIGARSAVFAPIEKLGVIIMDEEHDTSYYQSDPAPRYHAREVAAMRAYRAGAVLVLGSATPSLVSLVESGRGRSRMLKLSARHAGAVLPEVKVLNLTEYRFAMKGPLAVPLYNAIHEAVGRGEQVILLYNRRGFASFMQCEACGEVPQCPHCSVSLTYHKAQQHLRCHYCGFAASVPGSCRSCGEPGGLKMQGSGTQQVEEELGKLFPKLRVMRMDQDTTSRKNAHDQLLTAFGRGEADILIGTQLVAKGLDFPNVTVVGVVNADTELAFPSYRSNERMYQLLSQVAGRSGRAGKKGIVYLQTKQPDHVSIRHAKNHDYEGFARAELAGRKPLHYPPYARLLQVSFKGKDATYTRRTAEHFTAVMQGAKTGWPVLGPAPDAIERMNDEFRWLTLMKLPPGIGTAQLEKVCGYFWEWFEKNRPEGSSTVRITLSHEML
ncbi:MAG: primosomal protein N' [Candidatus Cyclonatronum sp.]|uniref:replication restart helicase PriA n=1 Tax=Cyclonatronum sp. TaxID=3024185 RepID=UPI0025BC3BEE|nr:primosomal protein N' [Cyclonatronum sp.]MCH8485444.1 primosomal protein N' [Cyclonatronum sp.]